MSRKRQWSSDQLDSELKEWLGILLEPVEVTGDGTEACLKELLSHKAGGVTKHYSETIKREVGTIWSMHSVSPTPVDNLYSIADCAAFVCVSYFPLEVAKSVG